MRKANEQTPATAAPESPAEAVARIAANICALQTRLATAETEHAHLTERQAVLRDERRQRLIAGTDTAALDATIDEVRHQLEKTTDALKALPEAIADCKAAHAVARGKMPSPCRGVWIPESSYAQILAGRIPGLMFVD